MNRLTGIVVLLVMLVIPLMDWIIPFPDTGFQMPISVREGSVASVSRPDEGIRVMRNGPIDGGSIQAGVLPGRVADTVGDGMQVSGSTMPLYLHPVLPWLGSEAKQASPPATMSSELPFSLAQDTLEARKAQSGVIPQLESARVAREPTERSKEASDGVFESVHGDTSVAVSGAHRAGSREGAGLDVRGIATYVHPSLAWDGVCCLMADGLTPYDPMASGLAAATGWPLHSLLRVCGPSGRCLQLEVRDRGLLTPFIHLDVSSYDFLVLGNSLGPGVITVTIEMLNGQRPSALPLIGHDVTNQGSEH